MADLNELIDKTNFYCEQNEAKARQLEERILKVPRMSKSYLLKSKVWRQLLNEIEKLTDG